MGQQRKVTRASAEARNARRVGGKLATPQCQPPKLELKNDSYSCAAAYAFNFTNIAANPFDRVGDKCFANPIV